jgi:hypothetical protein
MKRRIAIAGVGIDLRAVDASRWEALDALFGACLDSAGPASIAVDYQERAPEVPGRPPDQVSAEVAIWFDPDGVSARHLTGVCGRRVNDAIVVGGWRPGIEAVRAFRLATQAPLIDALGEHGRHALHAAALERDGSAVLVLGGSGAGKSTFAFAGSRGGWKIIADDLSIVDLSDAVYTSGLPKPVNVPSDALDLPPHGSRPLPNDERARWALPATAITARGRYPVRAVVTLGHSADSAEILETPASPDRLRRLIASLPLAGMPRAIRGFFPVAARLSRLPTYTYMHPADPTERVASAIALLERLRHDGDQ